MASTAIGIQYGLAELNPAGPIGVGLLKINAEIQADKAETKAECYRTKVQARVIGCGLFGWNMTLIGATAAAFSTATTYGAATVLGLAAGYGSMQTAKKDALIECYFPGSAGDIQIVGAEL